MIYLATPYTDKNPLVTLQRFHAALDLTLKLIKKGKAVFSPIVYSHQMAGTIGKDFQAWKQFDLAIIDASNECWFVMIPGWETSVGMKAEFAYARAKGIPCKLMQADGAMLDEWNTDLLLRQWGYRL